MDAGYRASNRVWIRVWIYIVSGHVFVAFLFLLFYVGSHKG
ncbi:small hydrophobic protein [Kitasatospora sp. NA04385]|nr:small hydrophobic protein [Kitasatospora sp. NA04385]